MRHRRQHRRQRVITLVLPDGVPAEALIAGEATAAAKGKAKAVTDGAPAA